MIYTKLWVEKEVDFDWNLLKFSCFKSADLKWGDFASREHLTLSGENFDCHNSGGAIAT